MEARAVNSVVRRQMDSPASWIWPLAGMSLGYYQSNIVSLVMTFALPMFFLIVYSFTYLINASPAKIRVGVAPRALDFVEEQISRVPPETVKIVPSTLRAKDMIRNSGVQIAIDEDELSHSIVAYATPSSASIARLLIWSMRPVAAGNTSFTPAIEVRLYSDPMSPVSFLPGVLLMSILNLALFTTGSKLLQERSSGTLRLLRMLPLRQWQVLAADLLGKAAIGIVQSLVFIAIAVFLTKVSLSAISVAMALVVCVFAMLCLLAFGAALGGALSSFSSGVHVFTAINLIVVFFGDVFFPASAFSATRPLALLIPTTYCADLLRHFMLGLETRFPWWVSTCYIALFTAGSIAVGVRRFRFVARP
jgi:hypothetical protein